MQHFGIGEFRPRFGDDARIEQIGHGSLKRRGGPREVSGAADIEVDFGGAEEHFEDGPFAVGIGAAGGLDLGEVFDGDNGGDILAVAGDDLGAVIEGFVDDVGEFGFGFLELPAFLAGGVHGRAFLLDAAG